MRKPHFIVLSMCAIFLGAAVAGSASAREPRLVFSPILKKYKSITDARKKLRKKEKKGQPLTGAEYYTLAFACGYEAPKSTSMILTALSRSKCKDKITDYYLEAGRRGTPEGFLAAALRETSPHDGFGFAQLAYQLAGDDIALRDDALDLMSKLKPRLGNVALANSQAEQISRQLVAAGRYSAHRSPADAQQLAAVTPQLGWLDFRNPRRCAWSNQALRVIEGSHRFDEKRRTKPTVPARVAVPGLAKPVLGRVSRPMRDAPNYVEVNVDFKGRWNGLTVLGLTDAFIEEGDGVWGKGIRFAEPVNVVANRLISAGFIVNANGSQREQADRVENSRYQGNNGRVQTMRQIDGIVTSIERSGGETVFLCNEVFGLGMG